MKDHPPGKMHSNFNFMFIAFLEFIAIFFLTWILITSHSIFAVERVKMKYEISYYMNLSETLTEKHREALLSVVNNNEPEKMHCTSHSLRECAKEIWTYQSPISMHPQSESALRRFAVIPEGVVDWHIPEQLELWKKLRTWKQSYDNNSPFYHNGMIPIEDDYVLYAMIMTFEPVTVIEIGSGHSTRTAHNAMLQLPQNRDRNHVCIEPFRTDVIDRNQNQNVPLRIIPNIVQDVDPSEFSSLKKNDILFIDSSHVIQAFGDTILELVFILPLLPIGTIVHIHDICLPENYPSEWLADWGSMSEFTEQYMLAAFLYGNSKWRVLWSNWKMGMDHPELYRDIGLPGEKHGSIWLLRIS